MDEYIFHIFGTLKSKITFKKSHYERSELD